MTNYEKIKAIATLSVEEIAEKYQDRICHEHLENIFYSKAWLESEVEN